MLVASLLLAGLVGCEDPSAPVSTVPDKIIVLGAARGDINGDVHGDVHEEVQLRISPGQIPVETLLQLHLQTTEPLQQVSAELTGVSMYMGRIPLRFSQDAATGGWISEFMLGACSDPKMTWQLQITLTDLNGQSRQLVTEFQSSWR